MCVVIMIGGLAGCGSNGSSGECGDGVVDSGEQCDDGASNSDTAVDACRLTCVPASCGDGVRDTDEECDGVAQCDATCKSTAVCGDGMVGGNEECDGGEDCFPAGHVDSAGEPNGCTFVRTAFRMTSLGVADPGIYAIPFPPLPCADLSLLALNPVLTATTLGDRPDCGFCDAIPEDALDGLVDLGFVFTFSSFDQGDGASMDASFVVSDCNALEPSPAASGGATPCAPTVTQTPLQADFSLTTQFSGTCLEPLAGTTDPTREIVSVEADSAPGCWVSDPTDFTVALGTIVQIPLTDTRIAAQWDADPAEGVVNGLISGFITEDAARAITIGDIDFVGGQDLFTTLSPGAVGDCIDQSELGPDGVTPGIYVYFFFSAERVPWEGGLACGNGMLDEGEACDPGIAAGQEGECAPLTADCVSTECVDATINAGDPCNPSCYRRPSTPPVDGDGCCSATSTTMDLDAITDTDCLASCDGGSIDHFEKCEIGDTETPCQDPAVICDDDDPCTRDFFSNQFLGGEISACIFCVAGGPAECGCDHEAIPDCP